MSAEQLFTQCKQEVIVPESALALPSLLSRVASVSALLGSRQRSEAFYDEQLDFFLSLKFPASKQEFDKPPTNLTFILMHLQVTLDASYISAEAAASTSLNSAHANPALADNKVRRPELPVSLGQPATFPPNTPHPVPASSQEDAAYVHADGVRLTSYTFGDVDRAGSSDKDFTILFDEQESAWIALYRLDASMAFTQGQPLNPLVCLTVSMTLRESVPATHLVRKVLSTTGIDQGASDRPRTTSGPPLRSQSVRHALHEVNLLSGIVARTTAGSGDKHHQLFLPSSRIGHSALMGPFWRVSDSAVDRSPLSSASSIATRPILRRSFRKTLKLVSGFHLRMRTVFVPYMVIPGVSDEEGAWIEAGAEEKTVILSVEIDTDSLDPQWGFSIESASVKVGGDGASTRLLSWGELGLAQPSHIFPLRIAPREQYNLLYAVNFLNGVRPAFGDDVSTSRQPQRTVSIVIEGRPYKQAKSGLSPDDYFTKSFSSRWNCILDLASMHLDTRQSSSGTNSNREFVPVQPSPFPLASPEARASQAQTSFVDEHEQQRQSMSRFFKNKPLPPLRSRDVDKQNSSSDQQATTSATGSQSSISRSHSAYPVQLPMGAMNSPITPTPNSSMTLASAARAENPHFTTPNAADKKTTIAVSVQLAPSSGTQMLGGTIRPGNYFWLEIFVFNESSWRRRFEIGYLMDEPSSSEPSSRSASRGIMPMENSLRIGPLYPQTCQTVRMQFLALEPGLHTINNLTLTDTESGYQTMLRSAIDVVVQEGVGT